MTTSEIPAGWAKIKLGEALPLKNGKGMPERERNTAGQIPVYGSSGIVGHHDSALLNLPSIVVGRKGNVGSVHLVRTASWPIDTVYFIQERPELNLAFCSYLLRSLSLARLDKSTAIPGLSRSDYDPIEVSFPPLAEQARIVEAIETQFSRLDAATAALERARANLKRYRAAVLNAACSGRLVPTEAELAQREGRSFESGTKLLERVDISRQTKTHGSKGRRKSLQTTVDQSSTKGNPEVLMIPNGWTRTTLGQITWSVKDGPHYSPKYSDEGIAFISGGNVRPEGVDFARAKRISADLYNELSKRCKPELGDILYTKGGTTGIARVNTYDIDFNVWVHVAVLKLCGDIAPFWVQHTLNSNFCTRQAKQLTHGVGNQDLGLTRMVNIVLPLPPFAEQHRIVAEVERRLSVVERMEAEISAGLKRAERLRQSILQKAFAGQLVHQDPNDEPASVLLDRIRARRANQAPAKVRQSAKGLVTKPLFD